MFYRDWSSEYNADLSSTGNEEERRFQPLELPPDIRFVLYSHILNQDLPNLILPRWLQHIQDQQEQTTGDSVIRRRPAASSFTNLQLSSRQVYEETSYVLYHQCHFSFNIAPCHASFLDGCLLPRYSGQLPQDKSYIPRIANIVLKANWDGYDWAKIQGSEWTEWKEVMSMVCDELPGFSGLRRLTLDWRGPNSCDALQPRMHQWLSITPYFQRLRARRPELVMEVLAWEVIPGSVPFKHRAVRTGFDVYFQNLQEASERPQNILKFPPDSGV